MQSVVAMFGWPEAFGVMAIILVLLGAKRMPDLLNGMKHGIREFNDATRREVQQEVAEALETQADEDDGNQSRRDEFLRWFLVALAVAAKCAAAYYLG